MQGLDMKRQSLFLHIRKEDNDYGHNEQPNDNRPYLEENHSICNANLSREPISTTL